MTDSYTVRTDGERIDRIARAQLGSWTGGIVEAILALNPGLASLPAILPVGTTILLPPRPVEGPARKPVAKIWGVA